MPDLVLEIGTDEMPVQTLSRLASLLWERAASELQHGSIACSEMRVSHTPRRLALWARDLSIAEQQVPADLLTRVLVRLTADLSFVSAPHWEGSSSSCIGPIRWLVALYDGDIIPVTMGSVPSDRLTRGHRADTSPIITLSNASEYRASLSSASVVIDRENRLNMVREGLAAAAEEIDEPSSIDESLLEGIAAAAEYPHLLKWDLPNGFPNLPTDFIHAALQKKGFVPLASKDESRTRFVTVADGKVDRQRVRSGLESAFSSCLSRCWSCFSEDRQRPLAEHVHALRDVPHKDGIGSLWDKMERLRALATGIAPSVTAEASLVDRVAFLCQADLVTGVVQSFPSLHGVAGAIYARLDGEPEEACLAIGVHALPIAPGTQPPAGAGLAVALADRLDEIATAVVAGNELNTRRGRQVVSGCDDLFRLAIGGEIDVDLSAPLHRIEDRYRTTAGKGKCKEVTDYLDGELSRFLETEYGIARNVTAAVALATRGNPYRAFLCAMALFAAQEKGTLSGLAESIERLAQSGVSGESGKFDPALFATEAERILWREYLKAEGKIDHLIGQREFAQAIDHLTALQGPIDRYVESIGMAGPVEENVKANRLAFAASIISLLIRVGDLRALGRKR